MNPALQYIESGGVFMVPILAVAFWGLLLLLERAIFLGTRDICLERQSRTFFSLLHNEGEQKAAQFMAKRRGMLARVIGIGLKNASHDVQRVEEKMAAVLLRELPAYTRFLDLMNVQAAALPIFGLLGTVTGMIATFRVVATSGTGDAQAMAGGIFVALTTTQAGLVAAVPIIFGQVMLNSRKKKVIAKTKEACAMFLDYLRDSHA